MFEFINSSWKEHEEELRYDAISGEVMVKELAEMVRKVEMETFKKRGVCEKVPIEECWKYAGRGPVGVKRVDTYKCDKENPEYLCRLVAMEIKRCNLHAATLPVAAKKCSSHCWRVDLGCA